MFTFDFIEILTGSMPFVIRSGDSFKFHLTLFCELLLSRWGATVLVTPELAVGDLSCT